MRNTCEKRHFKSACPVEQQDGGPRHAPACIKERCLPACRPAGLHTCMQTGLVFASRVPVLSVPKHALHLRNRHMRQQPQQGNARD